MGDKRLSGMWKDFLPPSMDLNTGREGLWLSHRVQTDIQTKALLSVLSGSCVTSCTEEQRQDPWSRTQTGVQGMWESSAIGWPGWVSVLCSCPWPMWSKNFRVSTFSLSHEVLPERGTKYHAIQYATWRCWTELPRLLLEQWGREQEILIYLLW